MASFKIDNRTFSTRDAGNGLVEVTYNGGVMLTVPKTTGVKAIKDAIQKYQMGRVKQWDKPTARQKKVAQKSASRKKTKSGGSGSTGA